MSQAKRTTSDEARPFLKWAGGKSQLLTQIAAHFPDELNNGSITQYVEPFLGGGAVFLAVAQRYRLRRIVLTDVNPELILAYCVVQQDVAGLIDRLQEHARRYLAVDEPARQAYYYQVRAAYNAQRQAFDYGRINPDAFEPAWTDRAAAMLFLNRTCYNGLFRVNSRGKFNVPFGRYKRPTLCDADNLQRVAALLQRVELCCAAYDASAPVIDAATFVYFDPPYRPLSRTANFTAYSQARFDDAEQIELAAYFARLHHTTGAKLMLSNSDPTNINPDDDFFDRHYAPFQRHRVYANRMINRRSDRRGKISELLITNY